MSNDNQRAFNDAVRQLRKQGRQAVSFEGGPCVYRGPNGVKCLVGALIADEHYRDRLEGQASYCLDVLLAVQRSGYRVSRPLLEEMQEAHDKSHSFEEVIESLKDVALNWKLDASVLTEAAA